MGALLAREPPSKFDSQVVQGAEWYTDVYGGDGFSQVRALTRLGIRAVFGGDELWRAKPALIKDIIRGGQSSRPRHLTVVGDGSTSRPRRATRAGSCGGLTAPARKPASSRTLWPEHGRRSRCC